MHRACVSFTGTSWDLSPHENGAGRGLGIIPMRTLGVLGGTPEAIYFPRRADHESSPFSCAAPPMAFPKGRDYCLQSGRCHMVCPRCDRARIERDGAVIRCAVCGMPYDPTPDREAQDVAAIPHWLAATPPVPDVQAALHVNASSLRS